MTPTTEETVFDIDSMLAQLRSIIDQREQLAQQDKDLSAQKTEIEGKLLTFHKSTGLNKFSGAGMTISFDDTALRATYDPEKWISIAQWAFNSGNGHIIHRRLTDSRVAELFDAGIALPDGLNIEAYTKISTRRI